MLRKISQTQTNTEWSQLYVVFKIVKLIKAKRKMVAARRWGKGKNGEILVEGYKVSITQDE